MNPEAEHLSSKLQMEHGGEAPHLRDKRTSRRDYLRRYMAEVYRSQDSKAKVGRRTREERLSALREAVRRMAVVSRIETALRRRAPGQDVFACLDIVVPVAAIRRVVSQIIDDEVLRRLHVTGDIRKLFRSRIATGEVVRDVGWRPLNVPCRFGCPEVILRVRRERRDLVRLQLLITFRREFQELWKRTFRGRLKWYEFHWPGLEVGRCRLIFQTLPTESWEVIEQTWPEFSPSQRRKLIPFPAECFLAFCDGWMSKQRF